MKRIVNIGIACLIVMLSATVNAAPRVLDQVVAIVDDNVITQSELQHQVAAVRQQLQQTNTPIPASKVLRKQVLQHLIDVDLQLQLAKRMGIDIDSTKVNEAIREIAKKNGLRLSEMRKKIEVQGLPYREYRSNILKQITIGQVQQKAVGASIKLGDEQVANFMKNEQRNSRANKLYHVKNILISLPEAPSSKVINGAKQVAKTLLTELRQGKDFSQAAVAHSAGHLALRGGDLDWRKLSALPEVFAKQLTTMKTGDIAGPIRTANGFHLIKLEGIRDGEKDRLTPEQARRLLFSRQFEQAVQTWLQGLRSKAFINIISANDAA